MIARTSLARGPTRACLEKVHSPLQALPEHGLEWASAYDANAFQTQNGVHSPPRWAHLWECWLGYERGNPTGASVLGYLPSFEATMAAHGKRG